MPTKRTTRTRNRSDMPLWAQELQRTGKAPAKGAPGWHDFLGWLFFDERVPGLREATAADVRLIDAD